jgi:hypothetical protein
MSVKWTNGTGNVSDGGLSMGNRTAGSTRKMSIISVRPTLGKRGKAAAERILMYRLVTGQGVADTSMNDIVEDALESHAKALEAKYGSIKNAATA